MSVETQPSISIIVPCYNYAHYLIETLNSVKNQIVDDWECIIVDDGSTDATAEVAGTFTYADSRFRYYFQENRGLSVARNTGIAYASGKFIQFLDADDLISEEKLLLQKAFMIAHPDTGVSFTEAFYFFSDQPEQRYRTFYIDHKGKQQVSDKRWIPQIDAKGVALLRCLFLANIAPVNSMLIRHELIDEVGGFDESYKYMEDWDFWLRCAFHGARFSYFDSEGAFALIRIHRASMSNSTFNMSLQFIRRLKQSESEVRARRISGIHLDAPDYRRSYNKVTRNLIREAGLLNFKRLKQVLRLISWPEFLRHYLSVLNSYRKNKY